VPLTEAQKAGLAEGRRIANEKRRQAAAAPVQQQVHQVEAAYICKQQMKVGDSIRQPGDLVPEAAQWPNLRRYLELGWIEFAPVINGTLQTLLPPPPNPNERLLEELKPEAPAKPLPVGAQYPAEGLVEMQCFNCRHVNHLAKELLEDQANEWQCFRCHQPQTVEQAGAYPVQDRKEYDRQASFRASGQQQRLGKSHIDARTPIDPEHPIPGR
jgi:hypothetical protein